MKFLIVVLIMLLGCTTLTQSKNDLILSYMADNTKLRLELAMWQEIATGLRDQLKKCETEEVESDIARQHRYSSSTRVRYTQWSMELDELHQEKVP